MTISITNDSQNSLAITNDAKSGVSTVGDKPGTYFDGLVPTDVVAGTGGKTLGELTPQDLITDFNITNETKA